MLTLKITKKINSDDDAFEKFKKRLQKIYERSREKDENLDIKLVFEEGIDKINPKLTSMFGYHHAIREIEYPSSLTILSRVDYSNVKINYDKTSINGYNPSNGIEIIGEATFLRKKIEKPIWINAGVRKISHNAFRESEIEKMIFLSQDVEIASNAFTNSNINKLYCGSLNLLHYFYNYLVNSINHVKRRGDSSLFSNIKLPINELIIPEEILPEFINLFCSHRLISDLLSLKIIIDCPNDFYHNYIYQNYLRILKSSMRKCQIIMDHDYVIETFAEVKDLYKTPNMDSYMSVINDKFTRILNGCYSEKMREIVLNLLLKIADENNAKLIGQKDDNYERFCNPNLTFSNGGVNELDMMLVELEGKVNFVSEKLKYYDETLQFIEKLQSEISTCELYTIDINYLDDSLISHIWQYLYLLNFVSSEIKEECLSRIINILNKFKEILTQKKTEMLNLFPNIDVNINDQFNFEIEFRKLFINEILSFYQKFLSLDEDNHFINSLKNQGIDEKEFEKHMKIKVIKSFIEDILLLEYMIPNKLMERIREIINYDLTTLNDDELQKIIEELAKIKVYLTFEEIKLKKQGLIRVRTINI